MKVNLDFGFAYLKGCNDTDTIIFPSICGEMQHDSFGWSNGSGLGITTNEGRWLFGEAAIQQSVFASRSQDNSWFTSDEYKAGILTAISELTKASGVEVELMLALPFSVWQADSYRIVERLQGEHTIHRNGRNRQTIKIVFGKRATFPQNLAPLFVHFLDSSGRPLLPQTGRDSINVAIFNGGGNTIEYSTVEFNLKKFLPQGIMAQSGTEENGSFNLTSVIKSIVLQEYGRKITDHEAFVIIRTGMLEIQNRDVDISKLIQPAKNLYLNSLLGICNTTWTKGKKVDRDDLFMFIVSGGQGPVLYEFFKGVGYHGNTVMSDNPQFDVVEGMRRLRKFLER